MARNIGDKMSLQTYEEDTRTECKYGAKCYQKNPAHHKAYKHPPTQKRDLQDDRRANTKKLKHDQHDQHTSEDDMGDERNLTDNDKNARRADKQPNPESKKDDISEYSDSGSGSPPPGKASISPNQKGQDKINTTTTTRREQISESSDSDSDSCIPRTPEKRPLSPENTTGKQQEKSDLKESALQKQNDQDGNSTLNTAKKEQISDRSNSESSEISRTPELAENKRGKTPPLTETGSTQELSALKLSCDAVTNESGNKTIKELFLVEMPDDFFEFWKFCKELNKVHPADALTSVGLSLVGPYDVIAGKFKGFETNKDMHFNTHWRYYYDTPEFQTVLKGDDKTQYHIGYFRDDPKQPPCFLASNAAAKGCVLTPLGENIFAAVNTYLESSIRTVGPFQKMKYSSMQKSVQAWAKKNDFSLSVVTPSMKKRRSKIVTKSFHTAGIVVPVEKKTELGYRELIESDARLKKILARIVEADNDDERDVFFSKLDPIITAAHIANDECDFGNSLELGIDLFCFGGKVLERAALPLLVTAYTLLRRPEFAQIIKEHLENRQEGSNLSIIPKK